MAKGKVKKKQNSQNESEIYDTWIDFSREITDRIKDITKGKAYEYERLYNIWTEYAQKMTEQVATNSPRDKTSFLDMQKVWTDYSDELGERFADILSKENGPYKELYEIWTEYSEKMSQHLSELMNESIKEQKDLYELWMDAFGMKKKSQNQELQYTVNDLGHLWLKMWEKSKDMYPTSPDVGFDYNTRLKELNELWIDSYSKMVMDVIRSPSFAKMNGNILDTNLEAIKLNDQLTKQYLTSLGMPTKESLDEIYQKLHDMDRKLAGISRSVNSKNKGPKK
ncbi:MAG: hypothetical protein JSV09_11880 [Thermoplasmata archaeon]|nr:MAG: hypothetical protein JSV09_11880 [Thermoplasmata archaeon]